jgi:hypothetical protein
LLDAIACAGHGCVVAANKTCYHVHTEMAYLLAASNNNSVFWQPNRHPFRRVADDACSDSWSGKL